ncbi:MAG: protease pro-enzyme activation domain-containing protein [Verrucomicrobiota bacterium]
MQPIGSLPDAARLNLTVGLPLRHREALASLVQQIYDPASPKFHRYLSPAEFADQFGPTKQDYQALIDFARANHFQVTGLHPNRTLLEVSASVADIRRVLRVNIRVYQHPTEPRAFYCPDAAPSIDAGIPVLAIEGLDNFSAPHANFKKAPIAPEGGAEPSGGSGPGGGYIGKDFRAAYAPGVTLTGRGQTAALVEFDGYYPSDIAAYESKAGLSSVTLSNVLVDGFGGAPSFQNSEVAADIDLLVSMAPGLSKILVYEESVFSPVDDLLNRIATDNLAAQISCSWIFISVDAVTDQIFQQFAAQGQSFFCASADFGADPPGQVSAPTGDPYITVVGGTVLSTTGTNGPWQSETVWSGSSGGFTTNYAIPSWQAGISMATNQGSTAYRNLPDVAMCAFNVFLIADDNTSESFYGTSAAAPLWAGFTALVNQQAAKYGNGPVGFLNPALYAIGAGAGYATNFHDITIGNNTNANSPNAYFAARGYDLCTGWGTPNGSNLINTLAPPDTLVMLPVAGFISSGPGGGPFNVTAENFLLTNEGTASLSWCLQSDAPWLSAWPTNGSLSPGATASVLVNLNAASNLLVGSYTAHLTLTNLGNGLLHHRSFTLQISDPLTLSPAAGYEFDGPPSGPFNAAAILCRLTNASQVAVNWNVVTNPPWLDVSPTNGVLGPFGAAVVNCSLNVAATNLPAGAWSAGVLFSNNTFAAGESLPLLFMIGQLVQNGGFETGDLTGWTLNGDTAYVSASTYDGAIHSGAYGAFLVNNGALGYLSQTIPTIPGQMYSVSLWLDSSDGATPNGFQVSWEGNVVYNETNLPGIGWTNLQFTLAATNPYSVLQIGFANAASFFGLDDISVTAAPPTLGGITPSAGPVAGGTTLTITGSGFQGHAAVAFGSVAAAAVTFNSATNLTVVTPASSTVGAVNVALTNADGQSAVLTNGFVFVGTPVITWTNPPALTYGGALGAAQLNASANVPGAFSYVPPAGTVLNAGSNLLSAAFTPNDSTDYYSVTDFVSLVVSPAPLSVTASNATRSYGITNPVFTGVIAGLRNGDNITASYGCGATSVSPAGTYPIIPNLADPGGRLPDYQVTIVDGTLTILAPVLPVFQAAFQSGNRIAFSWAATAGANYQVQYNSCLTATNWADLGGPITATNATVTVTDPVTDAQRFYRVLQVPQ